MICTMYMNVWIFNAFPSQGSQRGSDPDSEHDAGDREDHAARAKQRDRHQEGDLRRHHRVAPGLQRLLSLRANLQN